MTAEIAIMNKGAIALAADSAVTISVGKDSTKKIYNTVNKLFTLSKYHPVGVMVYGNSELMGIPWESIIKIYRENLDKKNYNSLEEFGNDFMGFLNNNPLFPLSVQDEYIKHIVISYYQFIRNSIDNEVKKIIKQKGKVSKDEIIKIINNVVSNIYNHWSKSKRLEQFSEEFTQELMERFESFIDIQIKNIFQELPLGDENVKNLKSIAYNLFCKEQFLTSYSGVVIAGFGKKDIFPAVNTYDVESVINNKLKYKTNKAKCEKINFKNTATIIPFAQSQNVTTFMEGLAPNCRKVIENYLNELFKKYPRQILKNLPLESEEDKKKLLEKLLNTSKEILTDFIKNLNYYINEKNVSPIINAVGFLPKDELASMAESLVNLTSFKQKISMDSETVGGPIDVAVISKGDGFVWIRRKHYFERDINPHYISRYLLNERTMNNEN
jgi:phosphopentomutase